MTSSQKRLYLVEGSDSKFLVEASSQAQALHAVTKDAYKVKAASALEVVGLLSGGAKVITTGVAPAVTETDPA